MLEEAAGQAGTAEPGARDLFQSVQRFKTLPDYLQIWPSHGAGSACGKGLGAIPSSTLGYEKMFNEGFQFESEDEFVQYILSDQPEAPPYFAVMKHVNKHGPKVINGKGLPAKLDAQTLTATVEQNQVIDLAPPKQFANQHVPGTINVWTKALARDAGWFVDYQQPLYLIAEEAALPEIMRVLGEMGIDNVEGYFETDEVVEAGLANESFDSLPPSRLRDQIENGNVALVDVRKQTEWNEGHIAQAQHLFLGTLINQVSKLPKDKPIVFQCKSGGRSAAACSIAQANGIKNVINLHGGIDRWRVEGMPIVSDHQPVVG